MTVAGLAAAAAGAFIGLVGGAGHRRASTWVGVIAVVIGVGNIIADITDEPLGVAGLCLLAALALGGVAVLLAPRLGEQPDEAGDDAPGESRPGPTTTLAATPAPTPGLPPIPNDIPQPPPEPPTP
jgi:hypothetical protein